MSREEFNIQPQAGILSIFSRLNYKEWYAIGEFVDNSTASYFGHEKIMNDYNFNKLTVYVDYDSFKNVLTITDDAYGMDINDFKRAVLMDQKPDNLNGRNEFGMGLKTAASWFGNVWSIESTQLNSDKKYYAEINIPKLKEEEKNTIDIIETPAKMIEHGTTITIKEITKPITSSSTKKKIKLLLSSMYRRDFKDNKLDLFFNGEKLSFEEIKVLNYEGKNWKKDIDFSFPFEKKIYHVTGNVGIMEKGSFPMAGFALFRYNRAIIGGSDSNYKPSKIFGQSQSQISLKLFGELNMEDFPVNQAKDGFIWSNGLEDEFLTQLKMCIKEYLDIAKLSKKEREAKENNNPIVIIDGKENNPFNNPIIDGEVRVPDSFEGSINFIDREYIIQVDPTTKKKIIVSWEIGKDGKWFDYDSNNGKILMNNNHPFLKKYCLNENYKELLESFAVSFVCSEELAIKASLTTGSIGEKYILPSVFENKMNIILKKLCADKK